MMLVLGRTGMRHEKGLAKDDDGNIYRAEDAEFIGLFEETILTL
jgi:hypothetical protein